MSEEAVDPMPPNYEEIHPLDRADLNRLLDSGNQDAILASLLSAAYYDPDWRWVQSLCLRFLDHPEKDIRRTAAICLGHLARIHGQLDIDIVLPRLTAIQAAGEINVEDAIDDIHTFLRRPS